MREGPPVCVVMIVMVVRGPGRSAGVLLRPGVSQLAGADVEERGAGQSWTPALHRVLTELP